VFFTGVSDAKGILNAPTASNHCWTAVHAHPGATDTKRVVIGGYAGSITSCLKHAVDGYSFWGAIIIAKLGKTWIVASFTKADSMEFVEELAALGQLGSQIGTLGGGGQAGLNLAQVRVIHMNYVSTNFDAFMLLTSAEYYHASVMLSFLPDAADVTPT